MDPFIAVWMVKIANFLVCVGEFFTDLLFGWTYTRGTRKEREVAWANYDSSAQLVTVIAQPNFVPGFPTPWNGAYMYRHEKYMDPREILKNDGIVLSHTTKTEAIFGVANPGVNLTDTTVFPFQVHAIYHGCKQHIRVPISTFHRMAEELGDPKVKLGITGMTARCGSTLLSQVMNKAPNTRSLSEPFAISSLWLQYSTGYFDMEELRQQLRSVIRILTKTSPGSNLERVFIKLDGYGSAQLGVMKELFPDTIFVLSTRHPLPSIKSFRKILFIFAAGLYGKSGQCWRNQGRPNPITPIKGKYPQVKERVRPWRQTMDYEELSILHYAGCLAALRDNGHIFHQVVIYEEFTADPKSAVKRLFELMGVKEDPSVGLAALESESQNGIFSHPVSTDDVSKEQKKSMDVIFGQYEIPIAADCSLEEFKRFVHGIAPCKA